MKQKLMTFPCEYHLKVIGQKRDEFEIEVYSIIKKEVKHLKEDAIRQRASRDGKYLALTITFEAKSKSQLDKIYKKLKKVNGLIMSL